MTSLRKIQSSRANGAKSTGPVSPAGKQASARNGLRHGMIAQTVVLEGESEERFMALLQALTAEHKPATEAQLGLVEIMAVSRWRHLRVWGIQKAGMDREMARHQGVPPIRAAIAFQNLSDNSRSLDLLHRYETAYDRQFSRALRNLLALQAAQPAPEPLLDFTITGATWKEPAEKAILRDEPNPISAHPIAAAIILLALLFSPRATAQPRIGDCPVFPTNNAWNVLIDKLPVVPNSQAMINNNGPTRGLHADLGTDMYGIPFVIVPPDQPFVPITFTYSDESDPGPYPIPPTAPVEGGSDAHVLIVQSGTCKLYEIYAAAKQPNGSWKGDAGAVFDLKSNRLRPDTWTSTDAAGLPILAGLLRYDEVAAGVINHALRLTVPSTRKAHVWPARHDASKLTDASYPPMGQRFRLKASYDISGFPPDAQVVLTALKKYGLMLADNGSSWFISGTSDLRWNLDTLTTIRKVTGNDLEAVDTSSMIVSIDSGQAKGASLRTVVPYSAAPVFDLSSNPTLSMTLAGDVSSSTITGFDDGAVYTFLICQDQTGGRAFTWPANVSGGAAVGQAPNSCTAQQFVSDGARLYATSTGSVSP